MGKSSLNITLFSLLFTGNVPRGVFCEQSSQKTRELRREIMRMHDFCASRSVLLVTEWTVTYCERSFFISWNIFDDRGIYVIFIQTHLHLHRCGIVGELYSTEVVEEEQDTKTDTERVGDFQDSIAGCGLSGDLGVDLLK